MGKQFVLTGFKCLLSRKPCYFASNSIARLGQSLFLLLCVLGWVSAAHATIPASQRAVLTSLYASTNGASRTNKTNWNGAVGTECAWFGIFCDGSQSNVTSISLGGNNLVGTLPSLTSLPALVGFYVFNNQLTGSIPSLSGLTALQVFNVNRNQLTGSIPLLSGLTTLQEFYVSHNQLTGAIPPLSGLTSLQVFYAVNNQLSGSIPLLSGLTALLDFRVHNNQLTGPVPATPPSLVAGLSNLCSNSLVSSGNSVTDAAWVTAAGNLLQTGPA